eukprot:1922085-Amphidinium_carterae.1
MNGRFPPEIPDVGIIGMTLRHLIGPHQRVVRHKTYFVPRLFSRCGILVGSAPDLSHARGT